MNRINHLGIIPDGSRRWAKGKNLDLLSSYRIAMVKLVEILRTCYGHGIGSVSIYLLSKANLKRTSAELEAVAEAEEELLAQLLPPLAKEFAFLVRVAGLVDLAPGRIQEGVRRILSVAGETSKNADSKNRLYLCVAYDPLDEIVSAAINSKSMVLESLWVPERVDLVVRTGGARTLSNFLPLQSSYARLVFLEDLFNDLSVDALLSIILEHEGQKLKFGE